MWYIYPVRRSSATPAAEQARIGHEGMAKSFQCSDAGVPCGAKITGSSEQEVLESAVEHGRKKHGVDLSASRTLSRYAASLVRDEDAPATGKDS